MKHLYFLLIVIIWGCQTDSSEKIQTIPIVSGDSLNGPFNLLEVKFTTVVKDTSIHRPNIRKDHVERRDLFDHFAMKRGDSIIVVNGCLGCMFTSNSFVISLKENSFNYILEESSCNYDIRFKPIKQKLILDDSIYNPGDTITGYIEYIGRYSPDSLNRYYEEASVSGYFKTIVKDSVYDYREDRQNRLEILLKDTLEFRKRLMNKISN